MVWWFTSRLCHFERHVTTPNTPYSCSASSHDWQHQQDSRVWKRRHGHLNYCRPQLFLSCSSKFHRPLTEESHLETLPSKQREWSKLFFLGNVLGAHHRWNKAQWERCGKYSLDDQRGHELNDVLVSINTNTYRPFKVVIFHRCRKLERPFRFRFMPIWHQSSSGGCRWEVIFHPGRHAP